MVLPGLRGSKQAWDPYYVDRYNNAYVSAAFPKGVQPKWRPTPKQAATLSLNREEEEC